MMSSLTVELRPGERLAVGDAVISYEQKSGRVARLKVSAPSDVPVGRHLDGAANYPKMLSDQVETGERRSAPESGQNPSRRNSNGTNDCRGQ